MISRSTLDAAHAALTAAFAAADTEEARACWRRLRALLETAVLFTPTPAPLFHVKLARMFERDAPAGWLHWCPGCKSPHGIFVEQPHPRTAAKWTFDGNELSPTFQPSIRCFTTAGKWVGEAWVPHGPEITTCHYFITAGMIQYCGDCQHPLNGQTVPLPDYPGDYLDT